MGNNVFYIYIRLRGATRSNLPPAVRKILFSDYGDVMHLSLSVCKEPEAEEVIAEKVKFWKDNMANIEADGGVAELVIHQIRISNGGLELSPTMVRAIAQANLSLHMTYTVCNLK